MDHLARDEALQRLEGLRAVDDVLMRRVFRDNLPLAQRVLRVVTGIGVFDKVEVDTSKWRFSTLR